jgi:hypothetical protein
MTGRGGYPRLQSFGRSRVRRASRNSSSCSLDSDSSSARTRSPPSTPSRAVFYALTALVLVLRDAQLRVTPVASQEALSASRLAA